MIYLKNFFINDGDRGGVCDRQTEDEYYPMDVFSQNRFERLDFEDITILYGGNGSGKTTMLNVIAEKLNVIRKKEYVRTKFFDSCIEYCCYNLQTRKLPIRNKFLASDDIFDHILSVRAENKQMRNKKDDTGDIYWNQKVDELRGMNNYYPDGKKYINMDNPDDIEKLRIYTEIHSKSGRKFVKARAGQMQRQFSNGENALQFFDKEIESDSIYLLDEPENSMSPQFQLQLKGLIEDSVRYKNCQFIIATHSPFILALRHAKIYNLDVLPVSVEKWNELENVRFYYDFFMSYKELFV